MRFVNLAGLIVAVVGTVIATGLAVYGLVISRNSLSISEKMLRDADGQRDRQEAHDRLMWLQTALNGLEPVQNYAAATNEIKYTDAQRWLRTALSVAGLREQLPLTLALTERPLSQGWAGVVEQVDGARREIYAVLEYESDRAYALTRLG
ncbi:MAG: hypothetical protein ACJ757_06855 [Gaiellaceae bacterium]